MKRELRIARPIVGIGGCDRLGLPELVDLDDPGRDRAPCALPDETAGKTGGQCETAEGGKPPVAGLDTGRTDTLIPDLRRALVRRFRLSGFAVSNGGSLEHEQSILLLDVGRHAAAAAIARADRMRDRGDAALHRLLTLHRLRPRSEEHTSELQ